MPDISIKMFSTFFGNALEDAKQYLFNFKSTYHDFNLIEDNVTCILFLQTLRGNPLEWYSSLLPNSITSWDVLEDLFVEMFITKVHSYVYFFAHTPSPIWTQANEMINFKEESNQRLDEICKSSYVAEDEDENSNLQK
jgi:hypothetical protein